MRVVFTGGGTGGHLYPAIAIADALRARDDASITFIGSADRLEARIVPAAGYALRTVPSRALVRRLSFELLRTIAENAAGIFAGLVMLAKIKPDIVIATGGYVAFPIVVATFVLRSLRIIRAPIALVEPNAHPGLTNRAVAPFVDEVWGAFPAAAPSFQRKYVHTGIPVRAALRRLPGRTAALRRIGLDPSLKTLLVMGGSQGARSINDALVSLLRNSGLPAGWQVLQITGSSEYDRVRASLPKAGPIVTPYLDDLTDAYAGCDLVVARAGASTLGELAAIGKPAILVPYPHAAADHQRANAALAVQTGAAFVLEDRDLSGPKLAGVLAEVTAPARLAAMSAAAERLRASDPIATILTRIDALSARKTAR